MSFYLTRAFSTQLLQYKQRCTDLESRLIRPTNEDLEYGSPLLLEGGRVGFSSVSTGPPPTLPQSQTPTALDLDDALWKLDQERVRNENLMTLNRDLRTELDETRKLNSALSSDLTKLSEDWDKLGRQMGEREAAWRAEEQAYSNYYASEHTKLLSLWKKVAGLKRDFAEVKGATGRDLGLLKNSLGRLANNVATGVVTATSSTPSPQQVRPKK